MEKWKEISAQLKKDGCTKVKLAVVDLDGVLRGKLMSIDKFLSIAEKGFGFCSVVFGWDIEDKAYDNVSITGWHTGYPDMNACVDLTTYRRIPWDNDLPFFLADFSSFNENKSLSVCPRSLLKGIINKTHSLGFKPVFSQEFEWFNFEVKPDELSKNGFQQLKPLTPGMFGYSILRSSLKKEYFNDLFDYCLQFNIPLEGLHTETGPGVYEAAIKYSDILTAADRAVLFKNSVKEIAYLHGIMATFMAKWTETLPGCGGHIHQSLWDENETVNLFYEEDDLLNMSETMKSYLAGQLYCLPHILPMYAPNINSYKRLVEGAWAPTTLTWGVDNRTTAFRVIAGSATSARLETRVPGSDVNPYLAMSACLASGLYGIEKKLPLNTAPTIGNGYREFKYGIIPSSLYDATFQMKSSELAFELFGQEFVEHFCKTREWECREFATKVTDWERKRYFEII